MATVLLFTSESRVLARIIAVSRPPIFGFRVLEQRPLNDRVQKPHPHMDVWVKVLVESDQIHVDMFLWIRNAGKKYEGGEDQITSLTLAAFIRDRFLADCGVINSSCRTSKQRIPTMWSLLVRPIRLAERLPCAVNRSVDRHRSSSSLAVRTTRSVTVYLVRPDAAARGASPTICFLVFASQYSRQQRQLVY